MRSQFLVGNDQRRVVQKERRLQLAGLGVAAADSVNFSLLFVLKQYFAEALAGLGHTLIFPFAAAASLFRAGMAWYQAHREGYQKRGVLRAVIEVLAALAVTAAVVGGFVAAALFASLAPLIFTAVSAAKTLYLGISSGYYALQASLTSDPGEKEKYKNQAMGSGIGAVINALATVAIAWVMVAGNLPLAILGVVAGVLGAAYAVYQALTLKTPREERGEKTGLFPASSTGRLHKALGIKRSHSMDRIHAPVKTEEAVQPAVPGIELIEARVPPKLGRSFSF